MKAILPLLFALAVALLPVQAQESKSAALPAKVVVALKPDKNPDAMLAEKKALETFLTTKLGRPVEVIIPLSSATILEGMASGTIDLGYLSATDLVNARDRNIADLLLAGEIAGHTWYESYWVTLKDKPYTSVADLRGKPVAFASRTSTSGFVVPLWDLARKGLIATNGAPEDFFGKGNVWFGSGYVSAIERVLSGDAEAAAVSYYVLDKDQHLSAEQRGKLRKLAAQGPVPTHVIAVRASLGDAARESLKQALNALNEPDQHALRDRVFTSKLVPADADAHLATLRPALRLAQSVR
jgi:phosphonate transport system substrate-binding protein